MIALPSEIYHNKTGKPCLFNITHIDNISSIMSYGILSYNNAKRLNHSSIAMNEIQMRREKVNVTNGMNLHQYANLYFDFRNPMLYKRKNIADELCILSVSLDVLNIEDCVVSDRNASTNMVRFYQPLDGINNIDFDKVFSKYWTHPDEIEQLNHKAIKCAEILVPYQIDYSYVTGVCVKTLNLKQKLLALGFDKTITVKQKCFF